MANALNWFEIPVQDIARATRFYETVLGASLTRMTEGAVPMAIFKSADDGSVGGALVADARQQPSASGTRVYLDVTGKLDACLDRVGNAGGRVLLPKTDIAPHGFMALISDTEGNTVGLHTPG